MTKRSCMFIFSAILLLTSLATAATLPKLEIGTTAPAFVGKDIDGVEHSLDKYLGENLVVLMFIATECPVSNDYNERMVELAKLYTGKKVTFIGINSNKQETVEEIKEHAQKNGLPFEIIKDGNNIIADLYGAQVTPEAYVLDAKGILRYHGRIDDSRDPDDMTSQDLKAALDALLEGREVPRPETKAFGCGIKRIKK
ncbi:MAG: thioredoxin family protein [Bacteroidota bacterium]